MDYDTAVEVFFQPRSPDDPPPGTVRRTSPARLLRDAVEPIASIGYWARPAYDRLSDEGLDVLTGYVWGRAAALGEPPAAVVVAAFAVWEPGLVTSAYEAGRAACPRAEVLRATEEGAVAALRDALSDQPAEVPAVAARLRAALEGADVAGRPLFAGLTALPWPADPMGQLWRACGLVREHRGGAHVAACVAAGLDAVEMNLLTEAWVGWEENEHARSRGWRHSSITGAAERLADRGLVVDGILTGAGRELREGIEDATDAAESRVLDALGDPAGLLVPLAAWSDAVVEHGSYPPDPYKRATG